MNQDFSGDKFKEYLKKIKNVEQDKCWLCGKTPDEIRKEYYEYMKHPSEDFEDLKIEDIVIMTYSTKKPICAACYFALKQNEDLIKEILEKPEEDVW